MLKETSKNAFGETTYLCSKCKRFKERIHFFKGPTHYGIQSACSTCTTKYKRIYDHAASPAVGASAEGSSPIVIPQGEYELLPKRSKRECRKDSEGWNILHCVRCQCWKRVRYFREASRSELANGNHRFSYYCRECEKEQRAPRVRLQNLKRYQKSDAEFFSKL